MTDNIELLAAKQRVENILLSNTGSYSGVGANLKEDTVTIYLRDPTEQAKKKAYSLLSSNKANGHEIQFISSGNVVALQCGYSRTSYSRPVCGGTSCGIGSVGAGTAGCVVYDPTTSDKYILTNNHVGAASSSIQNKYATEGDIIYAPGLLDSSGIKYPIGRLHKYIPFDETAMNLVDCALVKPNSPNDISEEIVGIGQLTGYIEPNEGMRTTKSGRTSSITEGDITDYNASIEVDFGNRVIRFANCIVTTPQGLPGDSGSILIEKSSNKATGLLFAGSDQITIYNRISYVLNSLNVKITPSGTVPQQVYATPGTTEYNVQSLAIAAVGIGLGVAAIPMLIKR